MDALPDAHWRSLVWMMKCAERSFRMIADHSVVSHLHHAKRVVRFKRFTSSRADFPEQFDANFLAELPLGLMFFYDVILTMTLRSASFTFYSRENRTISQGMMWSHISVSRQLV
jgi:hypothetical protein